MKTLAIDSPWHRLPWTLSTALLIWAAALWGLAYFMEEPGHLHVEPPPLDAQLIEEPAPAPTKSISPERPVAAPKPKPLPQVRPQQARAASQVSPPAEQTPAAPTAESPTNTGVSVLTAAPGGNSTPGEGQVPAGGSAQAGSDAGSTTQAGPYDGKGSSRGGNVYASSGARAIVRPEPQIPDDLREEAFNFTALARFHIAVDGSAKVELVKATPNPRLNRVLMDSLGKWRFIPAIRNGKPVASTEEIVVKLEVK